MSIADLERHVEDVMTNPARVKDLQDGRRAFLGQDGTIVVHNPNGADLGTVFSHRYDVDAYWISKLK